MYKKVPKLNLKKTSLIFAVFFSFLLLSQGALGASINVEGLNFEKVQPTYHNRVVNFNTSYLDKNISYEELLIPRKNTE